jgi:Ser/Thr protein kinase RdoA (MazF antagonist)
MDATVCPPDALYEAAYHFLPASSLSPDPSIAFTKAVGGVNNRVYHVNALSGEEFVLRVYNNGGNAIRVRYEHLVLEMISKQFEGKEYPFEVPTLIRTPEGLTYAPLTSSLVEANTEACMFKVIKGSIANVGSEGVALSAGAATAIILREMANMPPLPLPVPNPLFREIYKACPGQVITREQLGVLLHSAPFSHVAQEVDFLLLKLDEVDRHLEHTVLPEQQIHADLHLDNFLVADDAISGVLDFEFSSKDWRVMDLCVGLTKYIAIDGIDIRRMIALYIQGYREAGGRLTAQEVAFVPLGIYLRILSNVTFFAGRALAVPPQDSVDTLVKKIIPYAKRCHWVADNTEWLQTTLLPLTQP